MQTWKPTDLDRELFKTYLNGNKGTYNTTLNVDLDTATSIRLSQADLLPAESDSLKFNFDIESASKWLNLLSKCILRLRGLLFDGTIETISKPPTGKKMKQKPDYDTLRKVDNMIRFFAVILMQLPAIKWLFTQTSLQAHLELKVSTSAHLPNTAIPDIDFNILHLP